MMNGEGERGILNDVSRLLPGKRALGALTPGLVVAQRRRRTGGHTSRPLGAPSTEVADPNDLALGIQSRHAVGTGRDAVATTITTRLVDEAKSKLARLVVTGGNEDRILWTGDDTGRRHLVALAVERSRAFMTGVGEPAPIDEAAFLGARVNAQQRLLRPARTRMVQTRTDELAPATSHTERRITEDDGARVGRIVDDTSDMTSSEW